jgi:diguanylate cyclase (GGDEF)-like protein
MMDLNNFKSINDTYGHPVGDQALVEAAHLITQSLNGSQGLVVRYGGDEFAVLTFFYGTPNAISYEKQLKQDFARWNREHNNPYTLAISIGFSRYDPGDELKDMIKEADEALYKDKRS